MQKNLLIAGGLLAAALLLNFFVLRLFRQKSSFRGDHSLVGILTLMAVFCTLIDRSTSWPTLAGLFFLSLIPCYLGTVFSDLDIRLLGIGSHRNPLFHSGILFFLLFFAEKKYNSTGSAAAVAAFGIGIGSHLLWDLFDRSSVRWIPGRNLGRIWLGSHAVLCLALARAALSGHL